MRHRYADDSRGELSECTECGKSPFHRSHVNSSIEAMLKHARKRLNQRTKRLIAKHGAETFK